MRLIFAILGLFFLSVSAFAMENSVEDISRIISVSKLPPVFKSFKISGSYPPPLSAEKYPYGIHGYLQLTVGSRTDSSQSNSRIALGTLIGPNQVIIGAHHFRVSGNGYIKSLNFHLVNGSGENLPKVISASPASTLLFDQWRIGKEESKQQGGVAIVMLDQPIGNQTGYVSFYQDTGESLDTKTVYLAGIHGPINLEALGRGNQLFKAKVNENKIKSTRDCLLQVEAKPSLLQEAEIMLVRDGEKYAIIAFGRGVEDKETKGTFCSEQDLFQRLTNKRVQVLQEAIKKSPKSVLPGHPLRKMTQKIIAEKPSPEMPFLLNFERNSHASGVTPDERTLGITPGEELSDFQVVSEEESVPNSQQKSKKKVKRLDKPNEHHPENDIGNLSFLSHWYVITKNLVRPLAFLLRNGQDFHPLARAMAHEVMAYVDPVKFQVFADQKDCLGFFKYVFSKLSLSFLANYQKIALPDPNSELVQLDALKLPLRTQLDAIKENIKVREMVFNSLAGKAADGKIIPGPPMPEAEKRKRIVEQELMKLRAEQEKLKKELQEQEEKQLPKRVEIKQRYLLMLDQEALLSDAQKEERKCLEDPAGYMNSKFSQIKVKAGSGDMEALNHLGLCYFWGWGCKQNFEEAMNCFEKAANSGQWPKAYENIGLMLEGGFGIPKDEKSGITATAAYEQFAKQDVHGHLHLAHAHLMQETEMDRKKVLKHLRTAANQENFIALRALGKLDNKKQHFNINNCSPCTNFFQAYTECFKKYNSQLVEVEHKAQFKGLIARVPEGDLDVFPLLSQHYFFGRGCETNHYFAALCSAITHLARDSDVLKVVDHKQFQEMVQSLDSLFQHQKERQAKPEPSPLIEPSSLQKEQPLDEGQRPRAQTESSGLPEQPHTEEQQDPHLQGELLGTQQQRQIKSRDILNKLENLAKLKIRELNIGKELNKKFDFEVLLERGLRGQNKEVRQALGHCFLWGWQIEEKEFRDYEKAAVIFFLATKKETVSNETWQDLHAWLEGNPARKVETKEKENWLNPANSWRTCQEGYTLQARRLDAYFRLALKGYPVGYYKVGKAAMHDAPTLAFRCFIKLGNDPKAISNLAKLYCTVEGMSGTATQEELQRSQQMRAKEKQKRQVEAYKLWRQAAMQDLSEAQYYAAYCLYKGGCELAERWGVTSPNEKKGANAREKVDEKARKEALDKKRAEAREEVLRLLNLAYTNGYRVNNQTIEKFREPLPIGPNFRAKNASR